MGCEGGCCGTEKVLKVPSSPSQTTSSTATTPSADNNVPVEGSSKKCCSASETKTAGCCDEDCLTSIALRECEDGCTAASDAGVINACSGDKTEDHGGKSGCCSDKVAKGCSDVKNKSACKTKTDNCCAGPKQSGCGGGADACCDYSPAEKTSCQTGCYGDAPKPALNKQTDDCCSKLKQEPCDKPSAGCCSKKPESRGYAERPIEPCAASMKSASSGSTTPRMPCSNHLEAARKRYGSVLEAMGCMCKTLLAQGLESCCVSKRRLSPERIRQAGSSRASSVCKKSRDDSEKTAVRCSGSDAKGSVRRRDPCCKPAKSSITTKVDDCDFKDDCNSGCCEFKNEATRDDKDGIRIMTTAAEPIYSDNPDPERGLAAIEHVVLTVEGMTCTGCETKLARSMAAVPSAVNVKASIVMSRAEFDIDPSVTSAEQAIAHLETAAGFKIRKLNLSGAKLHIRATPEAKDILDRPPPAGVLDITSAKDTICISYDATVIGARDMIDHAFGRKLELAPIAPPENLAAGAKHVRHVGYMTLLSAVLTIPVLVMAWAPLPPHEVAYQSSSLALATLVQVVIAGPFYSSALRSLIFSRVIEMDLLVVISTSAAYIFSVVAYAHLMIGRPLAVGEFCESSTLLVTLIMLGRYISALARQKAVESVSVTSLQPTTALLVDTSEGTEKSIDARLLQYGDMFRVLPESTVVTDGIVKTGESEVDESMITGESVLVPKSVGSRVVAGSVNGPGLLNVEVARLPRENTISSIAEMVDQAKLSKPRIQEFADRVAGYFVPVILLTTAIVFCIWIAIDIEGRQYTGSHAAVDAITYAIAVLIVSCPCAIGLAVPMVIVIACGVGAERGVIFKSAQSIETSWKATHVVFDKTGTLTEGSPAVVEEVVLEKPLNKKNLRLLLGLVSGNKHPVSAAIAKHLATQVDRSVQPEDIKVVVRNGVEGSKDGLVLQAGNATWLGLKSHPAVEAMHDKGLTTFGFVVDNEPIAVFGLADTLSSEARTMIHELKSRGIDVSILSGDNEGAVHNVASELGIQPSNVQSRCTPQDKQAYIQKLTADKTNTVIFCGDGSNDAGALAQATVGLHTSAGTDVARSASDAVLMRPNISGLLTLMDVSRAAHRRIVLNFVWAFTYNLFAILLAAGAFVKGRIPPQYAGLGEVVSVLPVVLIALQMKWTKFGN